MNALAPAKTVKQVAREYAVTPRVVYNWVNGGILKHLKLPGGDIRIKPEYLIGFVPPRVRPSTARPVREKSEPLVALLGSYKPMVQFPPRAKEWIYFIQAGKDGPIKIGRAIDVAKRLTGLQCGNHQKLSLLAKIRGCPRLESHLHKTFAEERCGGEWFTASERLLRIVCDIKARRY